jgi:acyl-[acyl-carrier-protein]-phospholipid O-acyltransferase/long-chain-fatty-acid--[acyl-carrier-protein] ligase
MSTRDWLVVAGAIVLGVILFVAFLPWLIQPLLRLLLWTRYRIRIRGIENLPRRGPVLLIANHVTWIDGFLLAAVCPRRGRAMVNAGFINLPVLRHLARRVGLIPVPFAGPRAVREVIRTAREALDRGTVLGMFPEGQLTRNGLVGPFYRGIEAILEGRAHVPVIPVYFDNLWGSIFSHSGGRFFRKRPRGWRRTVNVVFGPPVAPPVSAFTARQALLAAGTRAYALRATPSPPLETLDPNLPHLDHPELGPLTGSTADFHQADVHQVGNKPGSVGHALPGVALRVVDAAGAPLSHNAEGRLEALVAGRDDWVDTGWKARIDRDGFVYLA